MSEPDYRELPPVEGETALARAERLLVALLPAIESRDMAIDLLYLVYPRLPANALRVIAAALFLRKLAQEPSVTINGHAHTVQHALPFVPRLSYAEIVFRARADGSWRHRRDLAVVWRARDGTRGILEHDASPLLVADGMVINVADAGGA